jgi:hypothetical protein
MAENYYQQDITLHDGRTVTVDLYRVSQKDYRAIFTADAEGQDAIVAKAVGMTGDELAELPRPDWKLIVDTFFELVRRPLAETPSDKPATT